MMNLLGLPLDVAVQKLHEADIHDIDIKEISSPRGYTPRGTLRVVRIENGGKIVTCARFPDTIRGTDDEC